MDRTIVVGDIPITVSRKRIRHVHLKVQAPDGRVTMSAPITVSMRRLQAFAGQRLEWIRRHRARMQAQVREAPTHYVNGETHNLRGQPYLLSVVERNGRPAVTVDGDCLTLFVRPGSDARRRARVMHTWHKSLLHDALPPMIAHWERQLNVRLNGYSLRRMKSRWGTCNCRTKHIRLNTDLVTKPSHLLEYVLVHELVHLIVPNHGRRFIALMDKHYPSWRDARRQLNAASLRAA